ncbi:MAG: hypothetical protein ABSA90_11775 [Xanthobacteraceae bacterium]|jgi:hypothetical protein
MPTAEQSATELMTLAVAAGNRPGRSLPFQTSGPPLSVSGFPGELQAAFLNAGYQISDLAAGLSYAVSQGWLLLGNTLGACQTYLLQWPGFAAGGGSAPTIAASAQQAINVMVNNLGGTAGSHFAAAGMGPSFVGTVGGNTFAIEDLLPGFWYAVAQGWLFPAGQDFEGPSFSLTAAGVAQAT